MKVLALIVVLCFVDSALSRSFNHLSNDKCVRTEAYICDYMCIEPTCENYDDPDIVQCNEISQDVAGYGICDPRGNAECVCRIGLVRDVVLGICIKPGFCKNKVDINTQVIGDFPGDEEILAEFLANNPGPFLTEPITGNEIVEEPEQQNLPEEHEEPNVYEGTQFFPQFPETEFTQIYENPQDFVEEQPQPVEDGGPQAPEIIYVKAPDLLTSAEEAIKQIIGIVKDQEQSLLGLFEVPNIFDETEFFPENPAIPIELTHELEYQQEQTDPEAVVSIPSAASITVQHVQTPSEKDKQILEIPPSKAEQNIPKTISELLQANLDELTNEEKGILRLVEAIVQIFKEQPEKLLENPKMVFDIFAKLLYVPDENKGVADVIQDFVDYFEAEREKVDGKQNRNYFANVIDSDAYNTNVEPITNVDQPTNEDKLIDDLSKIVQLYNNEAGVIIIVKNSDVPTKVNENNKPVVVYVENKK